MEKFEASKMGVLKQFVEDVRTYLRDYIEINFETMEEMMSHDKNGKNTASKSKKISQKFMKKKLQSGYLHI